MGIKNATLTTVYGRYSVGMTRAQAKDKKQFDKIDAMDGKKNGYLSQKDICDWRDRECKYQIAEGACQITIGALGVAGTALGTAATFGAGSVFAGASGGASICCAGAGLYNIADAKSEMDKTNKYRKEHGIK